MTLFDDDGQPARDTRFDPEALADSMAFPPDYVRQIPGDLALVERATRQEGDIRPTTTLAEVREYLHARREDDSVVCPACDQHVKVYRRSISSTSARALILLYRAAGTDFAHWPSILDKRADEAKLAHWGLIEGQPGERDDGSTRTGWWRVTDAGVDFIHRRIKVPKHVRLYAARSLGLDDSDGYIDIVDALGKKFRYDELMAGNG